MYIKTLPEDYVGALGPVIYTLNGFDPQEIIEIEIMDNSGVSPLGIKRLHGETQYTINTANYIQRSLSTEPINSSSYGFIHPSGRTASSRIRIGNTLSSASIVTAGNEKCPLRTKLSGSPVIIEITPEEHEEIAFIAAEGSLKATGEFYGKEKNTTLELTSTTTPGGLCVLCGSLKDIPGSVRFEDFDELKIVIADSMGTVAIQRYKIVTSKKSSVRLCWQNKYGQVDYYSFHVLEKSAKADKSKVRLKGGYEILGVSQYLSYTLVSQCETEKTIEWMSSILHSPRVWMMENSHPVPIDVTTSSAILKGQGPLSMALEVHRII